MLELVFFRKGYADLLNFPKRSVFAQPQEKTAAAAAAAAGVGGAGQEENEPAQQEAAVAGEGLKTS